MYYVCTQKDQILKGSIPNLFDQFTSKLKSNFNTIYITTSKCYGTRHHKACIRLIRIIFNHKNRFFHLIIIRIAYRIGFHHIGSGNSAYRIGFQHIGIGFHHVGQAFIRQEQDFIIQDFNMQEELFHHQDSTMKKNWWCPP